MLHAQEAEQDNRQEKQQQQLEQQTVTAIGGWLGQTQRRRQVSELLTIKELNGVPVSAREPADRRSSVDFFQGVDGDLTDLELSAGLASTVPVQSASREGQTVCLRFASSQPPDGVTLCGLQMWVRHTRRHPLECPHCGRFGHVPEACQQTGACIRCGCQHPAATTCRHRSVNCGGEHPADTPSSPRWQEERKVATLLATAPTPLSRRAVKATICEGYREVRSYAAAVRANLPGSPTKEPGPQRLIPALRCFIQSSVSPSTTSPLLSPPAELRRVRGTP
ncbi:hypothetical protein MRX96_009905 [Rhipicephalus microplus]